MFKNRFDAGSKLSEIIASFSLDQPVVLALPRGGVPVAFEIAKKLKAPLDIFTVRKIGAPDNPEFGIGAVAEEDVKILDWKSINQLRIPLEKIYETVNHEEKELKRRAMLYRNGRKLLELSGRTVILVDDGLATGVTAKAAIEGVKKRKPKSIIFAAPVCSSQSEEELKIITQTICLKSSPYFKAVGQWYKDFREVTDGEVLSLLSKKS